MFEAAANIALILIAIAVWGYWIVAMCRWDGKCHCDRSKCRECMYYPDCPHSKEDNEK